MSSNPIEIDNEELRIAVTSAVLNTLPESLRELVTKHLMVEGHPSRCVLNATFNVCVELFSEVAAESAHRTISKDFESKIMSQNHLIVHLMTKLGVTECEFTNDELRVASGYNAILKEFKGESLVLEKRGVN